MLNKDRFSNDNDMVDAFNLDPCPHHAWCLARWCFAEYSEDTLTYYRELDRLHLGTCALTKAIKRLEKASARKEARHG